MNAKQISSLGRRPTGRARKISLLLPLAVSALLLVLGGCGGLNDDPAGGGLSVRYGFSGSDDGSSAQASSATIEPQAIEPQAIESPPLYEEVLTIVIGAIVITHEKTEGNGIEPYAAEDITEGTGITDRQRELLEADLEQSIVFMEIVQLPTTDDFVSFPIPPDNAGQWQLLAVGMRRRIEALSDIVSDSSIFYGFIDEFLNGKVTPGEELSLFLKLLPACGSRYEPKGCPGNPL